MEAASVSSAQERDEESMSGEREGEKEMGCDGMGWDDQILVKVIPLPLWIKHQQPWRRTVRNWIPLSRNERERDRWGGRGGTAGYKVMIQTGQSTIWYRTKHHVTKHDYLICDVTVSMRSLTGFLLYLLFCFKWQIKRQLKERKKEKSFYPFYLLINSSTSFPYVSGNTYLKLPLSVYRFKDMPTKQHAIQDTPTFPYMAAQIC